MSGPPEWQTESLLAELLSVVQPQELPWRPLPGPQTLAYELDVDELLYGGSAGGGKTDLILGLAITRHQASLVMRREYTQLAQLIDRAVDIVGTTRGLNRNEHRFRLPDGRVIQFGAMEREEDWRKFQGRPFDLLAFDELTQFTERQYVTLIAWNRSVRPGQRLRVVGASNPPTTPSGWWVYRRFAPWLDPRHPDPARPGEIRYYVVVDGEERRVDGPQPVTIRGIRYQPLSRSFIPARLTDNPYLNRPDYLARLQSLPEPLRSQLLFGEWHVGLDDEANQAIPTRWVQTAMARPPHPGAAAFTLDQVGVDVARGGDDFTVIARRRGTEVLPLIVLPGKLTPDGPSVAAAVLEALDPTERASTTVVIDATGVGASVVDTLRQAIPRVVPWNGAARTFPLQRDRSGRFTFANDRSLGWWLLREALDPVHGIALRLPQDDHLLAELTAPKFLVRAGGAILIERKDDVRKRLGRSTDRADAVVLATTPTTALLPTPSLRRRERTVRYDASPDPVTDAFAPTTTPEPTDPIATLDLDTADWWTIP